MNICSLSGIYELSGADKKCDAVIPGDFHSALLKAELIPDPYYGTNETDVQWVGQTDWIIRRSFQFRKEDCVRTWLVLTGADTFFTVFINGRKAGYGDNMFRRWRFDVTKILSDGMNTLEIRFDSAVKKASSEAKKLSYPVPFSMYRVYAPHCNLIRKVQCHGGWDWGPCLMVSGIYGSIQLESVAYGYMDNVTVRYEKNGKDWKVFVKTGYYSLYNGTRKFDFEVTDGGLVLAKETKEFSVVKGMNVLSLVLVVKDPEIWLTSDELAEFGRNENKLYRLTVKCENSDYEITKKIAFRTIDIDTKNGALCFYVNGRSIFAKGSNWIPADALPSRQTSEKIKDLLISAVQAHMNMIRVWGGGQFESDSFYDLCDSLGLLIWHDCMFACAMYPATNEFLANVSEELAYQISRLQSHPSIALWCGNNENIGALSWFPETRANRDRYLIDYDRLYHGTVEKAVRTYDPARMWWPSSPCAGTGKDTLNDNWHSDKSGDMHFWSVWHEKKSFSEYLTVQPRFVSEFGYEAFPSVEEIKTYAAEDQLNLTSPVMEFHQRSVGGNSIILESFSRYFRFPEGFANMIYLSQIQQALAIKTAVTYWRSLRPRCSGTLYWQLNDVWPDASWSSIGYSGKWKLLHYAVKDAFAPVCVTIYEKNGVCKVFIMNDTSKTLDVSLQLHFLGFDGKPVQKTESVRVSASADKAVKVREFRADEFTCPVSDCFVFVELTAAAEDGKKYNADDTFFPALYKQCSLNRAKITVQVLQAVHSVYTVKLSADVPAFFVSLDTEDFPGTFSRNMFTLLPERPVTLSFTAKNGDVSAEQFKQALVVKSLRDTYK
ncbi:MAG: glycoside hydrolase family 2 protein [Treponema sp.]|nr:glycoside hydrolase family 2 protein [Treponema sp.]